MNHDEYSKIDALNWSTLKQMDTSPAFLKHKSEHPEESSDSPAFRFGRAIHCHILEPGEFDKRYVVVPDFEQSARDAHGGNLRTKAAQQMRDELQYDWESKTDPNAERLSQEDMRAIIRGAEAVAKHRYAHALLCESTGKEQLVQWETMGVQCKARLDCLGIRVVDIKSTRRNNLQDLLRDCSTFAYHAQVAWYHDGAVAAGLIDGRTPPALIAIHAPTDSTYTDVAVLDMKNAPLTLETGRNHYMRLLERYIGCRSARWWPGMAPQPVTWDLPEWYIKKEEDR